MSASPSSDLQTAMADGASTPRPEVQTLQDDGERWNWLIKNLGEPVCRKLGYYRIPDDFILSVVIPVYNETNTIHEILAGSAPSRSPSRSSSSTTAPPTAPATCSSEMDEADPT